MISDELFEHLKSLSYCVYCRKYREEGRGNLCKNCERKLMSEKKKERSDRVIAQAARELTKAIAKAGSEKVIQEMPMLLTRFKERAGGIDAVADMLYDDMQRLRGEGLTVDQLKTFDYKDTIILRYHEILMKAIGKKDELAAQADMSSIKEEDLKATLAGLAMELLERDDSLKRRIAIDYIKENPDVVKDAIDESVSHIIDGGVIEDGHT